MFEIRCTQCHADLTVPDNEIGFRLYLVEQSKYNKPSCAVSAITYDNSHYYFCGYECLDGWLFDREIERRGW